MLIDAQDAARLRMRAITRRCRHTAARALSALFCSQRIAMPRHAMPLLFILLSYAAADVIFTILPPQRAGCTRYAVRYRRRRYAAPCRRAADFQRCCGMLLQRSMSPLRYMLAASCFAAVAASATLLRHYAVAMPMLMPP